MRGTSSAITDRRVAVRVTRDALRQIRGGHPWVFDRSITSTSHDGAPGDLAVVFDDKRRFVAIGLWDPTSPIRLRVLHHGSPRPIDASFLGSRLAAALELRRPLLDDHTTTGYRIVNGESDGLPGLVLDRYDRTLVLKLYTSAWIPHLAMLTSLAEELDPERIVVRLSRMVAASADGIADGATVLGPTPTGPVEFLERGLVFGAEVVRGHKTGHFLDQRENRQLVGSRSAGAAVLDVFASTGGFSVHAAAGGATGLTAVDISRPALETAQRNLARNDFGTPFIARAGDAFEQMSEFVGRGRQWDLVVIDPPSFAPRQAAVAKGLAAYARLTELGLSLTRTGGLFVQSSCSARIGAADFHAQIDRVAGEHGVQLVDVDRTGHPLDHPASIPEAHYLKTRFATVQR